eukprot:sb/3472240/
MEHTGRAKFERIAAKIVRRDPLNRLSHLPGTIDTPQSTLTSVEHNKGVLFWEDFLFQQISQNLRRSMTFSSKFIFMTGMNFVHSLDQEREMGPKILTCDLIHHPMDQITCKGSGPHFQYMCLVINIVKWEQESGLVIRSTTPWIRSHGRRGQNEPLGQFEPCAARLSPS